MEPQTVEVAKSGITEILQNPLAMTLVGAVAGLISGGVEAIIRYRTIKEDLEANLTSPESARRHSFWSLVRTAGEVGLVGAASLLLKQPFFITYALGRAIPASAVDIHLHRNAANMSVDADLNTGIY